MLQSRQTQAYKLTSSSVSHPRSAPIPRGPSRKPSSQRGGRSCRRRRDSVDTRPLSLSPKQAHLRPEVEPEAVARTRSKATQLREGLAHEAPSAFQLGGEKHAQGCSACWGRHWQPPLTSGSASPVHGADGRSWHSVLGPWGPSRGLCCRPPVRKPQEPCRRRALLSGVASTAGSVFQPETEDDQVPPRTGLGVASTSRRTAEEHTDPRAGHGRRARRKAGQASSARPTHTSQPCLSSRIHV